MKIRQILYVLLCLGLLSLFPGCAATPERESTGEYVDDVGITSKVKAAILKEQGLKSAQINVETYKGIVQLSGFVDSEESKRKAGEVAGSVNGVKSVINNLTMKPK